MVARWLSASQFGLWEFIIDLVTFASYPLGLVTFWVTRDVARGRLVGRTAIFVAMAMSAGGVALYLLLGLFSYSRVASSVVPFTLAILLVPSSYWNQISNSIVAGYRPEAAGYSLLASEAAKLLSAYPLLYIYKTGITGVIIALTIAYLSQALVSTVATRGATMADLRLSEARRWFETPWLPAMTTLPYIIGIADTFLASLAFGTTITGYYQAAFSVASIVGYSTYLSSALYPRLLAGGRDDLPALMMDFSLLFGIPMAVGASVLAPSLLFILKPQYVVGSLGVVILSFSSLLFAVSVILDQTLLGRDRADLEHRSFRNYLKSDLFFVAAINLGYALSYNLVMLVSLALGSRAGVSTSELLAYWGSSQFLTTAAIVGIKGVRAGARGGVFPLGSIARYSIASAVMGVFLYFLAGNILATTLDTVGFGLRLLITTAFGLALYFGILFLIDGKFRRLVLALLNVFY